MESLPKNTPMSIEYSAQTERSLLRADIDKAVENRRQAERKEEVERLFDDSPISEKEEEMDLYRQRRIEELKKGIEDNRIRMFGTEIENKKGQEVSEAIESILDTQVDFVALGEIFSEMQVRSGEEGRGILPRKNILSDADHFLGKATADYNNREDLITFYPKMLIEKKISTSEREFKNIILSTLIHEEAHAASKNIVYVKPDGLMGKIKTIFSRNTDQTNVSGYHTNGEGYDLFQVFNEGVTELIAQEVYDEYFRRSGDGSNHGEETAYHETYPGERAIVDIFCERIAHEVGVPRDVVWTSVKQGYFSGLPLSSQELKNAFEQIFSEEFLVDMKLDASIYDKQEDDRGRFIEAVIQQASQAPISSETRERIIQNLSELTS